MEATLRYGEREKKMFTPFRNKIIGPLFGMLLQLLSFSRFATSYTHSHAHTHTYNMSAYVRIRHIYYMYTLNQNVIEKRREVKKRRRFKQQE